MASARLSRYLGLQPLFRQGALVETECAPASCVKQQKATRIDTFFRNMIISIWSPKLR